MVFPEPSPVDPYPKPAYGLALAIVHQEYSSIRLPPNLFSCTWNGEGSVTMSVPVNDLQNGVTLTARATNTSYGDNPNDPTWCDPNPWYPQNETFEITWNLF